MNKVKEIETLLKEWKSSLERASNRNLPSADYCCGGVQALKKVLEILKRPSNKVDAVCVCIYRSYSEIHFFKFCPGCGKPLE